MKSSPLPQLRSPQSRSPRQRFSTVASQPVRRVSMGFALLAGVLFWQPAIGIAGSLDPDDRPQWVPEPMTAMTAQFVAIHPRRPPVLFLIQPLNEEPEYGLPKPIVTKVSTDVATVPVSYWSVVMGLAGLSVGVVVGASLFGRSGTTVTEITINHQITRSRLHHHRSGNQTSQHQPSLHLANDVHPPQSRETISETSEDVSHNHEQSLNFQSLFSQAPIGLAQLNLYGHILSCNEQLSVTLDTCAENLIGMNIFDQIHLEDRANFKLSKEEILLRKIVNVSMDVRLLKKEGDYLWMTIHLAPYYPDNAAIKNALQQKSKQKNIQGYICAVKDISTRKTLELNLRKIACYHQSLERMGQALRSSLELPILLSTTARAICRELVAEQVAIFQLDQDWAIWRSISDYRMDDDLPTTTNIAIPDSRVNENASPAHEPDVITRLKSLKMVCLDLPLREQSPETPVQGYASQFQSPPNQTSPLGLVSETLTQPMLTPAILNRSNLVQNQNSIDAVAGSVTDLLPTSENFTDPFVQSLSHHFPGQWVLSPLQGFYGVWGAIGLRRVDCPWSTDDKAMIQAISDRFSSVIQQSDLYEKTQRQLRKFQALNRFMEAVHTSLNLEENFRAIVQEMGGLLSLDRASIVQFDQTRKIWKNVADFRIDETWEDAFGLEVSDLNNSIAQRLHRFETFYIEDDENSTDSVNRQFYQAFPGNWLYAPLRHGVELWGALSFNRRQIMRPWTAGEIELLQTVAERLSIAIEQSALYHDLQVVNQRLEELAAIARHPSSLT